MKNTQKNGIIINKNLYIGSDFVPLLSIIIPVYNVEKYIFECLESITKQKFRDYEVIIIDDGSVDKTNIICSDFCSHYENFRLFTSNHDGVSKARNVGLHKARGQYVMFLDGDDYIDLNSLSYISKLILSTKEDAYVSNFKTVINDGCDRKLYDRQINSNMINGKRMSEVLNYIKVSKIVFTVWRFIIKKDLILKNKLFFVEYIVHEDEEWVIKMLCHIKSLYYIDKSYYNYRLHNNSITTTLSLFNVYCYYNVVTILTKYAINEKVKYKKDFYLFYAKKLSKYATKLISTVYDTKKAKVRKKNILICGGSRCGKSTLARRISRKFNYNLVSLDFIITAFQYGMPNMNVNHIRRDLNMLDEISGFMYSYIRALNHNSKNSYNINYVIEGCYLKLEDFVTKFNQNNFMIIVLGYDGNTNQLFNDIRENDTEKDWTKELSDDELLKYCHRVIKDCKKLKKYCKSNNILYYDMSGDRDEKIFSIIDKVRVENGL